MESDNGPTDNEQTGDYEQSGGDVSAPPPVVIPPGAWAGYAPGADTSALMAAFRNAWDSPQNPKAQGRAETVKIVVHGNNPITGYSVILKQHP